MIVSFLLILLAAFIGIIAVRTVRFTPKPQPKTSNESVSFDKDASVDALAQLIRCKTVSRWDQELEDHAEFEKLIALLPKLYPHVFETCDFQQLPDRALLFRWSGKQSGNPSVLMAHYDVVPVNEENWDKPPFDAIIEDGVAKMPDRLAFAGSVATMDRLVRNMVQLAEMVRVTWRVSSSRTTSAV